jgi:hypothetical protein
MPETPKRDRRTSISPGREIPRTRKIDVSALALLLDEWMQEDEKEQHETFEELRRALDQSRPDGYKLFP